MTSWWKRRSLKFRLVLWFTAVASGILMALIPLLHVFIEHLLRTELDKQLEIDWNLVAAHLEFDGQERVVWRSESPATPESPGYAGTWFDVWLGETLLLNHWPAHGVEITDLPHGKSPVLHTVELIDHRPARALEQVAVIEGREVLLRVFREEAGLHATLRAIGLGLGLCVPLAALLAALGGYLMAGRVLRPIEVAAEQARRITSDSLSSRLPNPQPHDELGQLISIFNATLGRLEDSFSALKRFTADASHELRTPLTALRAVGEVGLREHSEVGALRETVSSMLEEAQRQQEMVDFMLQLARLENKDSPVPLVDLALDGVINTLTEYLTPLAEEKGQSILIEGERGQYARAEETLLRQALMNILHNAIRFSPPGSPVTVFTARRAGSVVIGVVDKGPGIAPEEQEKVFERFYRIDKSRSRAEGGTGLGLAIAKLAMKRIGGSIELHSESGRGSEFRLVLPASRRTKGNMPEGS